MSAVFEPRAISDAQLASYREKGFVVIDAIYSPAEVARMNAIIDDLVDMALEDGAKVIWH